MLREKDDEDGPKTLHQALSLFCPHLQVSHLWLPGSDSDWEDWALTINPFYVPYAVWKAWTAMLPFRPQWVTAAMQAAVYPPWEPRRSKFRPNTSSGEHLELGFEPLSLWLSVRSLLCQLNHLCLPFISSCLYKRNRVDQGTVSFRQKNVSLEWRNHWFYCLSSFSKSYSVVSLKQGAWDRECAVCQPLCSCVWARVWISFCVCEEM